MAQKMETIVSLHQIRVSQCQCHQR